VKRLIFGAMLCVVALGFMGCNSTKAQNNEIRWEYKSLVNTKNVNIAAVYNSVRQVLVNEDIPSFTTQLKNKYAIETEWLGIRHGREPIMDPNARVPPPPDTRYPTYIKYFIDIDQKGYGISAITNSGGIQWVSYDQSYQPNVFVDVMPQTEYWDAVTSLSRQINVCIKNRIDGGGYEEFFVGPGSPRPFYSGSTYPAQTPAWTYPEVPRNFPPPAQSLGSIGIGTPSLSPMSLASSDNYGQGVLNPSNLPNQPGQQWVPLSGTNSAFPGRR
jgi:hypothetical protein